MERADEENREEAIRLTHARLDHILVLGLPFYHGLYSRKTSIFGPKGTKSRIARLFDGVFH